MGCWTVWAPSRSGSVLRYYGLTISNKGEAVKWVRLQLFGHIIVGFRFYGTSVKSSRHDLGGQCRSTLFIVPVSTGLVLYKLLRVCWLGCVCVWSSWVSTQSKEDICSIHCGLRQHIALSCIKHHLARGIWLQNEIACSTLPWEKRILFHPYEFKQIWIKLWYVTMKMWNLDKAT